MRDLVSLHQYVENMPESQKAIYYIATDSLQSAKIAPLGDQVAQVHKGWAYNQGMGCIQPQLTRVRWVPNSVQVGTLRGSRFSLQLLLLRLVCVRLPKLMLRILPRLLPICKLLL